MEKIQEMPQPGPTAPTAPLPTAPPSYEEAVAQSGYVANLPNSPPYPAAGSQMPMPTPFVPQGTSAPITAPPSQSNAPYPQQFGAQQTFSPPPPQEVRIVHQHVAVSLGPNAVKMRCPTCHVDIKTTTVSDHQPSAHICCFILCLLGCCLCSCLPYCMSAFLSVHHFCPNCKTYIGTWKG